MGVRGGRVCRGSRLRRPRLQGECPSRSRRRGAVGGGTGSKPSSGSPSTGASHRASRTPGRPNARCTDPSGATRPMSTSTATHPPRSRAPIHMVAADGRLALRTRPTTRRADREQAAEQHAVARASTTGLRASRTLHRDKGRGRTFVAPAIEHGSDPTVRTPARSRGNTVAVESASRRRPQRGNHR